MRSKKIARAHTKFYTNTSYFSMLNQIATFKVAISFIGVAGNLKWQILNFVLNLNIVLSLISVKSLKKVTKFDKIGYKGNKKCSFTLPTHPKRQDYPIIFFILAMAWLSTSTSSYTRTSKPSTTAKVCGWQHSNVVCCCLLIYQSASHMRGWATTVVLSMLYVPFLGPTQKDAAANIYYILSFGSVLLCWRIRYHLWE